MSSYTLFFIISDTIRALNSIIVPKITFISLSYRGIMFFQHHHGLATPSLLKTVGSRSPKSEQYLRVYFTNENRQDSCLKIEMIDQVGLKSMFSIVVRVVYSLWVS